MGRLDIKSLKPRRDSSGHEQGYYKPKNPEKYIGDLNSVIYRSSWELKFLIFCDNEDRVVKYSSELYSVAYHNFKTKRLNYYNIDFYAEILNDSEKIDKWLIEVKPMKYVKKPSPPKRYSEKSLKTYKHNLETWMINEVKFSAARAFARENDMKFGIVTEGFAYNNFLTYK